MAEPAAQRAEAPQGASRRSPIREVLADESFRAFWSAQFIAQLVGGSLRFAFVWLALELSDWPRAAGLVSLAAGLPALVLSLPAGAWSDRVDRRRLIVAGTLAMGSVLALTALGVASGRMTLWSAALLAAGVSAAHASMTPAQQAVVPSMVAPSRLTTAVGLQTFSMQIAFFAGALVNGVAIRTLGVAPAFGVLAGLCVVSALAMRRVHIPDVRDGGAERRGMLHEAREGLAFVWRTEPLRSLMAAGSIVGVTWGVMQINLPVIAKEVMDKSALEASVLIGAFAPGTLLSSLYIASRRELARPGLIFAIALGVGLGPGAVLVGASVSYGITLGLMAIWGLFGGAAMTTQRSLVQARTPPIMMGRVMGIMILTMVGSFPIAAGLSAMLTPILGPGGAVAAVGAATTLLAPLLVFRKAIRRAVVEGVSPS